MRQSVNKYRPGKRIPHLRLRVTWESSEPPRKEDVALKLSGAVNPDGEGKKVSFIFECGPYFYAHSKCILLRVEGVFVLGSEVYIYRAKRLL